MPFCWKDFFLPLVPFISFFAGLIRCLCRFQTWESYSSLLAPLLASKLSQQLIDVASLQDAFSTFPSVIALDLHTQIICNVSITMYSVINNVHFCSSTER